MLASLRRARGSGLILTGCLGQLRAQASGKLRDHSSVLADRAQQAVTMCMNEAG